MRKRLRPYLTALLAALVGACGGATVPSHPVSTSDTNALVTVRSPHFILTTDLGAPRASELIASMERDWDAMTGVWFECALDATWVPLEVVVLQPGGLSERLGRAVTSTTASWVSPVAPREPVVLMEWDATSNAAPYREELAHRLLARCWLSQAPWVHAGMADMVSSMTLREGEIRIEGLAWARATETPPLLRESLPDLHELRTLSHHRFNVAPARASAWAAVAALAMGDASVRRAFAGYLRALGGFGSEADAYAAHLAEPDVQHLVDDFVYAPTRYTTTLRYAPSSPPPTSAPTPLSDAEVALFWAGHLDWDDGAALDRANAYLDVADALSEGAGPESQALRAAIMAHAGDISGAIAYLARAVDASPESDELRFAHLGARLMQPIPREDWQAGFDRAELEALAPRASTAREHDLLARAWVTRFREAQPSFDSARAATRLDPSSAPSWETMGYILMAAREGELARRAYLSAAALTGHHTDRTGTTLARQAAVGAYEAQADEWCEDVPSFGEAMRTDEALTSAAEGLPPDAVAPQRGALSAHLIREVIRAAFPQVTACANDAERSGASANGRVTIRFLIVSDGSVSGGQVQENTTSSRALACCILQHVAGLRFPPPDGGGRVSVTYPWTIE